jgi:transposase-like protein
MYSKAFRALMIQKMTDPEGPRPVSLAEEFGVSRSSLYRWVSEADTLEIAGNAEPPSFTESMQRLTNMKRPQDWSAEDCMLPNSSSGVIRFESKPAKRVETNSGVGEGAPAKR